MNKILAILVLIFISSAAFGKTLQIINVPALTKPPIIDGEISKGEWDTASGAPVSLNLSTGQTSDVMSEFRIGRSGNILYFFMDASRIGREPLAQKRDRDGAVWEDDGVEIFLISGKTKMHTIINAYGDIYDGLGQVGPFMADSMDTKWNASWIVKTKAVKPARTASGGFIIEASLDLSKLPVDLPKDSDQWGFQVALNLRYHNPGSCWHVPASGAFHTDFGNLIWGGNTNRIGSLALKKAGTALVITGNFTESTMISFNGQSDYITGNYEKSFAIPSDKKYTISLSNPSFAYEMSGTVLNGIEADSTFISPNGDGLNDKLMLDLNTTAGEPYSVDLTDKSGNSIGYIARNKTASTDKTHLEWNGKIAGKITPDGDYIIKLLSGNGSTAGIVPVKIDTSVKVKPVAYRIDNTFPIGTWYEGHPSYNGSSWDPAEAEKFYDKHFGIMQDMGINYIAVPNLPEALNDPLLRMAQKHNIKVALFDIPLYDLVGHTERISESTVLAAAQSEYAKLNKYPAFTRYQVKDEPFPAEIPNLITVQRILAMVDPTRPAFACFQQPAALKRYVESTKLSEVVFDHYPISGKTPAQSVGSFVSDYQYWVSNCGNNPHWAVLQAFSRLEDWREPSAEELRSMTYTALAYGAKGLFFFLYNDMPGVLNGMVRFDGTKQPVYYKTIALTQELVKLKPLLESLKKINAENHSDYVTGSFKTPKNQSVLIIASGRPDKSQIVQIKGVSGEWKDVLTNQTYSSSASTLIIPLNPGAGRVLIKE